MRPQTFQCVVKLVTWEFEHTKCILCAS